MIGSNMYFMLLLYVFLQDLAARGELRRRIAKSKAGQLCERKFTTSEVPDVILP